MRKSIYRAALFLITMCVFTMSFGQNLTISTIAGNGIAGDNGDGGNALTAQLRPYKLAVDASNNIYVIDFVNQKIRKINANGIISTIAGGGINGPGNGGPAISAQLYAPTGIAVDNNGNIYVAEQNSNRVRKINTNGIIDNFAGTGSAGFSGDGGAAISAQLNGSFNVSVDHLGNVFITDGLNARIRKVDVNGIITTIAGNGTAGFSGDGGLATSASIAMNGSTFVDALNNIFIADLNNWRVRKISPNGIISTIAGFNSSLYSGDGGLATLASLTGPLDVIADNLGNIFISDIWGGNRIRKIDNQGIITTIAGGISGFAGDGGPAASALMSQVGIALDINGNILIADAGNNRVRKISPVLSPTITSFNSASGPVGSLVTITGTNLSNPTSLTIGGVSAIPISINGTTLVAMVMPGATTGNVSITTVGGTVTSATNFTVEASGIPNTQQGNKLVGTGNIGNSEQGYSVALSADGNTAVVSGLNDNGNAGAVWIYVRSGNTWTQQGNKLVGSDAIGNATQGASIAISKDGNTVLIGGENDNTSVGAAWVFTRTGNVWSQQGNKLIGTGGSINAAQGMSVALSADGYTAIIGGFMDNGGVGAVWVFTRTGNNWTQQGTKLVGTGSDFNSNIGISVSLSADGNTAIIGGYNDNDRTGACWVFTRTGNLWSQQGSKLIPNDLSGKPFFGGSVSLSADGNTAVIGGTGDNNNEGAIWVFVRSGNTWTQQGAKLIGTGNVGAAFQGFKVAISADGNRIVEGAFFDNSFQGAAWLFTRTGNTWAQEGNKIFGTGNVGASQQGVSVAISADGNTICIGGNADDNRIGAAWIFVPGSGSGSGGGGAVSGGGSGGLESKSLGDAVVKRVYAKAQSNLNGPDDYSKMQLVERPNNIKQITGIGSGASIKLAGFMPDISAKGFTAYNSTPLDITSITNAKEVLSIDFTANKQCKAVAFATKTQGELYDHTKPICDRLKGASLVSVENMNLGGFDFVKYTLNNEKGQLEYATSFSVGMKSGRNDFSIQSTWLLKDYISDETMFNFQLWAATPELVKAMVNDVLTKLQSIAPIKSIANASIPATYILAGKREAQNLNLIVTNASPNTSGYFTLEDKANETNLGTATRKIPFTINSNAVTNVSIPMSDLYESTITMYVNGEMKDVVYMSDGTWYADYNKSTTTINSFNISNDANRTVTSDEFPLMRNVALNANSIDYVSIVKLLKGGGVETDLTPYKGLKITASGGYNLHITLVKNSTANWNDQYFKDIKLDQGQKDYFVSLDKFVSNASKDKILANDITTVVFSIEVGSNGNTSPINTTLSNVSFTKEDLTIANSLEIKEVQVYPNPANGGKFICSFLSDKATELTLKVNDITGRQILTKQITANKGQNSVPVTISNFTNGFHILSLEGTGIKYQAKKVMITN